MSKPDTWMPWYVADFMLDTTKLNDAETGSYALLLMHLWNHGGSLPDDDDDLARYARCDQKDWPKRRKRLAIFFDISDGVWRQKRLTKELVKATHVYDSKVENGRKGGRPPKPIETEQKPAGFDSPNRNETEQVTESKHNHNHKDTQPFPKSKERVEKTKVAATPLPSWLPTETWEAFKRHRVACKAKLSIDAHNLILRELGKLQEQGHDPVAVIEQSIARGWKGVFAYKRTGQGLSKAGAATVTNLSDWKPPEESDASKH
jgi:uncharacterized protein YdaU (DUF1376 family)